MGISHDIETNPGRLSLADALFSSTQQRVLGLLFGQPERSFFGAEVISLLGMGSGGVQRELKKLADSGLVRVFRVGNQKHYQANPESPIYAELVALIRKTVGLVEPLRGALAASPEAIDLALVYGSVAKGGATAASDIDLLLVSETLTLESAYGMLADVESTLGRPINPALYTNAEFEKRLRDGNPFLHKVLSGDTILLQGRLPDDFRSSAESGPHRPAQT